MSWMSGPISTSVGATLYALLTGRAPFEGDNAVQVVAAVLDKQPAPISGFRSDVPAALSQVVMRCLEKRRESRFESYATLREALLPFGTEAPEPAPLGLRFVAGLFDELICMFPYLVYAMLLGNDLVNDWLGTRDIRTFAYVLLYLVGRLAYFAITEGLWGAGLGKLLCGLRVVRPGHGAPGMMRAAARALLLSASEIIGYGGQFLITDAATFRARVSANQWVLSDVTWILFVLLCVTMRRNNGYAAVQDLATGTRVIIKARSQTRPRLGRALKSFHHRIPALQLVRICSSERHPSINGRPHTTSFSADRLDQRIHSRCSSRKRSPP
jgi:uncharacterized RDD family membrane protein YckC